MRTGAGGGAERRARGPSTWQVASRLSHAPDGDVRGVLPPRCSQEGVIEERREFLGPAHKSSFRVPSQLGTSLVFKYTLEKA